MVHPRILTYLSNIHFLFLYSFIKSIFHKSVEIIITNIKMSTSILITIQNQISLYGYLIVMILGDIGNLFSVLIFSQYRRNACAIYLIALALINSVFLTYNCFTQVFPFYYGDETIRAFALCKLNQYLPNIFGQIGNTMIIAACIDRFLLTSDRASYRAFSTPKRAKWLIFFTIIFWPLFVSFIPVISTIVNGKCHTFGTDGIITSVYLVVFIGFLPPIILGVFGYLAYRNMRQVHNRIQPVINNQINANNFAKRRDRELWIMVISEALVYILTASLFPISLTEMLISQNIIPNKSIQYLQIESFLLFISSWLLFINRATPFYICLIVSKQFRQNFKQLIIRFYQKLTRQQPQPVHIVGRTQQGSTIRDTAV